MKESGDSTLSTVVCPEVSVSSLLPPLTSGVNEAFLYDALASFLSTCNLLAFALLFSR